MSCGGYTKIREIGSGSFGKAYLVQKNKGDEEKKLVVMKQIDVSRMDKKERASTETEVKCLSSLKHPYVVRYHESFMHERYLCIVMDYCEGGDLFQLIQGHKNRGRPIPETNVLQWFTQMALGLKYVHDKHILHRDIKTQNVLLTGKDGRHTAKIADFGISRFLEGPNALARTVVGTPYYLSPEMVNKQPYSWPCDIWALGCVLYEMCALRVPFDANDMRQLVDRITRTNAPRIPNSYSKDLADLCAEMLSRDASRRPTAAALVQHPFLQKEIKRLLGDKDGSGGVKGGEDDKRRPLGDVGNQHQRGPSPGPGNPPSKPSSRCPSPAQPQHRHPSPSRGASPRQHGENHHGHHHRAPSSENHHGHHQRAPSSENRHGGHRENIPSARAPSPRQHHKDHPPTPQVRPSRAPSPAGGWGGHR